MRRLLIAGLSLMAVAVAAPAKDATVHVPVTVAAGKSGPTIDRHIFGQFAEHLGHGIYEGIWVGKDSPIPNTRGIRNDVVAALKELHVPDVRWPGGCFADEYNWRRGIGPKRMPAMNPNWGGVVEPNTFGTDEFMDFIQQIGSEAYVSVNLGTGTPQEAAEWLEYMTAPTEDALGQERAANGHPDPYKVAMVGLGNEAWGCGGSMAPEFYVDEMKRFARGTRDYNPAQAEPANAMKRVAVGPDTAKTEYTEAVMKAWKNKVWSWDIEGLSMHNYTVGGWPPHLLATGFSQKDYAAALKEALGMDTLIRKHEAIMNKYDPKKKVALVVDEWGIWLAPAPGSNPGFLVQQNSQRDALLAALTINIFARHADRVRAANIAQMVNVLQAMIMTDKEKMLTTPTYHVFHMYVPFQDATLIPVTYKPDHFTIDKITLPRVDVIAARDKAGKVWVAVTNLSPLRPAEIDLSVPGLQASSAAGQTLVAPAIDSVNTFDKPDTVSPKPISAAMSRGRLVLAVAPASVTVVSLEP